MLTANHIQILQHIRNSSESTRADLSHLTNLSQPTIARLVGELRTQGWVVGSRPGDTHNGPGRPTSVLRVNPEAGYTLGLEFGREHLIACALDANEEVIYWREYIAPPPFVADSTTMDQLLEVIRTAAEEARVCWERVRAVGLALHGVASAGGEWIPWPQSAYPYPAREYLEERLERPVLVEDVSRAFAEAEHRFGAGVGVADLIYLFIGGLGIGSGIFVNNTLLKS